MVNTVRRASSASTAAMIAPTRMRARRANTGFRGPRSATASMHLQMRIAPQLAGRQKSGAIAAGKPLFGAAVAACAPPRGDARDGLIPRRAAAQGRAQIDAEARVQAQVPHAV